MTDTLPTSIPRALAAVAPHVDTAAWTAALTAPMRSSGLTTPRRIAMFLGQCAVESGFTALIEDLDYSTEGLCATWPDRFVPGSTLAKSCTFSPERLGSYVYAEMLGNGSEASGDGWTFRGRGLIQITGRTDYSRFARSVGRQPDAAFLAWCATPAGAAQSACWWWGARGGMNALADAWDVADVTRRINGALGRYPARLTACSAALRALGAVPKVPDRVVEDEADALMDRFNPEVPKFLN